MYQEYLLNKKKKNKVLPQLNQKNIKVTRNNNKFLHV